MFCLIKVNVTKGNINILKIWTQNFNAVRNFKVAVHVVSVCYQTHTIFVPLNLLFSRKPGVFLKLSFECLCIGGANSCWTSLKCHLNEISEWLHKFAYNSNLAVAIIHTFPWRKIFNFPLRSSTDIEMIFIEECCLNLKFISRIPHKFQRNILRKLNHNFKFLLLKKDSPDQSLSFAPEKEQQTLSTFEKRN